ncbi:hypothetical protein [Neobacillus mesonae]|uniref:hypothetical protein n=1 Tax=Neobacillus mesonae TaxID=1193713 RepID=UPI0025723E77|nr:hypothetical protein [Neobacillus mesonae]
MNKVVLMLVMIFFFASGNGSAAEMKVTGKEVEIKDQVTKMFIYGTLETWIVMHASDIYRKEYRATSVLREGPKPENIRIWIQPMKKVSKESSDGIEYTHLIRITLPYEKVVIDNKKEIKAVDTLVYAVNPFILTACFETGKSEKQFKLINSHHEVLP